MLKTTLFEPSNAGCWSSSSPWTLGTRRWTRSSRASVRIDQSDARWNGEALDPLDAVVPVASFSQLHVLEHWHFAAHLRVAAAVAIAVAICSLLRRDAHSMQLLRGVPRVRRAPSSPQPLQRYSGLLDNNRLYYTTINLTLEFGRENNQKLPVCYLALVNGLNTSIKNTR